MVKSCLISRVDGKFSGFIKQGFFGIKSLKMIGGGAKIWRKM